MRRFLELFGLGLIFFLNIDPLGNMPFCAIIQ